jgi:glycerophosphoryl diester phosphodiesterase
LEEVKSLRVKQRSVVRDNYLDGFLTLLTFEEFLQFARQKSEELGIEVGIYIEMKHTPYFNKVRTGYPLRKRQLSGAPSDTSSYSPAVLLI